MARLLRMLFFLAPLTLLMHCIDTEPDRTSGINLEDICFGRDSGTEISAFPYYTTPHDCVVSNDHVLAAINGPYFSIDNEGAVPETLGIVYIRGKQLGNRQGRKSGYFTVGLDGQIGVSTVSPDDFSNYSFVIGTHPILVSDGNVNAQALEKRYNKTRKYRSAIGTKGSNEICFAVSESMLTMTEWATMLKENGYKHAINLDGGSISQMAVRREGKVVRYGGGKANTALVLVAYNQSH